MRRGARLAGVLAAGACATPALAQVGYPPPESPFRDVEYRQEFTTFGGYFSAATDDAGVAPRSGPALGVRYELRIGGPAQLMVRAMRVQSERRLVDAGLAAPGRDLGTRQQGLYVADLGISLNVTGQKTWHGIIPVLNGGLGLATDFQGDADPQADTTRTGYKFGTPFALSFGGGVRWAPGGRYQVRADVGDYLYQIKYPASFFSAPVGVTPVLGSSVKQNQWKHNLALTLGLSVLFSR